MTLTHISLFSGIGGFDLAAEWAGFETIGMVEIDPYCQKVLHKHWPNVKIVGDIRDVNKETFADTRCLRQAECQEQATGIEQCGETAFENTRCELLKGCEVQSLSDKETREGDASINQRPSGTPRDIFSGSPSLPPVTLITGGFPCQPFSVAGKRKGTADDRYLWPEMLRVIKAYKPSWVVGENVAGIIRMELDNCISDLENAGYEVQTFVIPACAVNAPHRRDRCWIVGNRNCEGLPRYLQGERAGSYRNRIRSRKDSVMCTGQDVADSSQQLLDWSREPGTGGWRESANSNWWAVEPGVGRVAHGVPRRVDRLKCLGNAIVPQVAYPILKGIADIERSSNDTYTPFTSLYCLGDKSISQRCPFFIYPS